MNIETAKKLKAGDDVVLNSGVLSRVLSTGFAISGEDMMFEVFNKYDGTIEVMNTEIMALDF